MKLNNANEEDKWLRALNWKWNKSKSAKRWAHMKFKRAWRKLLNFSPCLPLPSPSLLSPAPQKDKTETTSVFVFLLKFHSPLFFLWKKVRICNSPPRAKIKVLYVLIMTHVSQFYINKTYLCYPPIMIWKIINHIQILKARTICSSLLFFMKVDL